MGQSPTSTDAPRLHFPPLDGLRGVAILLVVFHHCFDPAPTGSALVELIHTINRAGWVGVNLFFVLSGFLIGGILIESRGSPGYYRSFYARRSLRIFPLYYLFLAVFFYVVPPLLGVAGYSPTDYRGKWIYFLYVANMGEALGVGPKPVALDSLWSLSVEEQVYLIWPALIALCPRGRLAKLMAAIMAGSLHWRVGTLASHRSILLAFAWTPACLDAFAAGTIAALAVRSGRDPLVVRDSARRWLFGSALFLIGFCLGQGHFSFWTMPKGVLTVGLTALSIGFASGIAFLVCDAPRSLPNRMLSVGWLRSVGKYSYAIYLFHMPIGMAVARLLARSVGDPAYRSVSIQAVWSLATLAASYVLAFVSWHIVEKHFLKLKRAFPTRGRAVPTVSTGD